MLQYKGHNAGNANHVSVEYLSTYKVLDYHMSTKLFEARMEGRKLSYLQLSYSPLFILVSIPNLTSFISIFTFINICLIFAKLIVPLSSLDSTG